MEVHRFQGADVVVLDGLQLPPYKMHIYILTNRIGREGRKIMLSSAFFVFSIIYHCTIAFQFILV